MAMYRLQILTNERGQMSPKGTKCALTPFDSARILDVAQHLHIPQLISYLFGACDLTAALDAYTPVRIPAQSRGSDSLL